MFYLNWLEEVEAESLADLIATDDLVELLETGSLTVKVGGKEFVIELHVEAA